MSCTLYYTWKGEHAAQPFDSLLLASVVYEEIKDKYPPVWVYNESGDLVLGVEPEGFTRPALTRPSGSE
jgi:hypothetical protein